MQLIDSYIDKFRPDVQQAGLTARVFAERIIARLDALVLATEDQDPLEHLIPQQFTTAGAVVTPQDICMVPPGERWELEVLSMYSDAATTITILKDGTMLTGAVLTAAGFSAPSLNRPIKLAPGAVIQVTSTGGNVRGYMQVTKYIPKPRTVARGAGGIVLDQPGGRVDTEDQTGRHSTPGIYAGINVNGERHA